MNPGRRAGPNGRAKASPEKEILCKAGLLFLSGERRWGAPVTKLLLYFPNALQMFPSPPPHQWQQKLDHLTVALV